MTDRLSIAVNDFASRVLMSVSIKHISLIGFLNEPKFILLRTVLQGVCLPTVKWSNSSISNNSI